MRRLWIAFYVFLFVLVAVAKAAYGQEPRSPTPNICWVHAIAYVDKDGNVSGPTCPKAKHRDHWTHGLIAGAVAAQVADTRSSLDAFGPNKRFREENNILRGMSKGQFVATKLSIAALSTAGLWVAHKHVKWPTRIAAISIIAVIGSAAIHNVHVTRSRR